jgi:3'-phosphoadenosine 5'-phosphosulfate (PAPS) 3'-phosphatase
MMRFNIKLFRILASRRVVTIPVSRPLLPKTSLIPHQGRLILPITTTVISLCLKTYFSTATSTTLGLTTIPKMPDNDQVNLLDLGAAAVAATIAASEPIRSYSNVGGDDDKQQNARLKLDGSVVTDADYAAQLRIIRTLRKVGGDYIIVGEEEQNEGDQAADESEHDDSIFQLTRVEVSNRFYGVEGCPLQEGELPETIPSLSAGQEVAPDSNMAEHIVDASRVRVYVDPLDGTKSYANGDYDAVTILVAIILDNAPYFGVITKPFGYKGHASLLNTKCVVLYGGDLLRGVYFAGVNDALSIQQSEVPRAVISSSRSEGIVKNFVDHLASEHIVHPEPLEVSGAGEKSLRLIVGSEDESLWFFPKPGTSRWDVAASDALLRPLGGRLTDKNGNELDYSKSREDAENMEGLIACNSVALHEKCIRIYREGNWDDQL